MLRTLKTTALLIAATAGSAVAYLLGTYLVSALPRLLLAAFTTVELEGFRPPDYFALFAPFKLPQPVTRFPSEGGPLLYALYQGSFLLWGVLLVMLALAAARRARGWVKVLLVQGIFWIVFYVGLLAGIAVARSWGPVATAPRALWPAGAGSLWLRVPLGLLVGFATAAVLHVSIRSLLDSAGEARGSRLLALVQWLALPSLLAALFVNYQLLRFWSPLLAAFLLGPGVLLLLAGLPAAFGRARAAPPLRPSLIGGAGVIALAGLLAGGLFGYSELARFAHRKDFTAQLSRYWRLELEGAAAASAEAEPLAAEADRRVERLAERLGVQLPNPALRAYYYASTETKERMTGDDQPFSLTARDEVHHLLDPEGRLTDERGDALLLLRRAWGKPGSDAVALALARYAAGRFHDYELRDYAARITREEGIYGLLDVLQLEADYLSPLVCDALGGAWVDSLVEHRGPSVLPLLYRTRLAATTREEFARALGSSWEGLEREWHAAQVSNARRALSLPARPLRAKFFHRGISFSHELGGGWGYGSDRAREQLERIRELGANAVAVVPYAGTRAPREPRIFFGTDETDARVIRTLEFARRLGLRTMLKPQLYSRGFTGDIRFEQEGDFRRWFFLYRRWLLHFARLAELYDVDLLVVGTELGGVTRHEAAWRGLIADLRRVYSGPLTYAAHWGSEFERLPFWDALDYLGLNMYYPLAAAGEMPAADSPRVRALVEKFAALSHRYGKPVLFTEVGYPAHASAAVEPWSEADGRLDLEQQRRCTETVFTAFYNQPWFAGLYWWKWPSHGDGNRFDTSYNPIGKPAAEVLARWYGTPGLRKGSLATPNAVESSNSQGGMR